MTCFSIHALSSKGMLRFLCAWRCLNVLNVQYILTKKTKLKRQSKYFAIVAPQSATILNAFFQTVIFNLIKYNDIKIIPRVFYFHQTIFFTLRFFSINTFFKNAVLMKICWSVRRSYYTLDWLCWPSCKNKCPKYYRLEDQIYYFISQS